jgi:hypothetical protein
MAKNLGSLCILLLLGVAAVLVQDYNILVATSQSSQQQHRSLREAPQQRIGNNNVGKDAIPGYSQLDIQAAMPYFHAWYQRILVFDGQTWNTYAIGHNSTKVHPEFKSSGRLYQIIPLLVHAFTHNFPNRFKPGQPAFQVLFTEADLISSACGVNGKKCPDDKFPPILSFGTTFKDKSVLPTAKQFPAPARWFACFYNWKIHNKGRCGLNQKVNYGLLYEKLKNQVVWRGADWPFLPHIKALQGEGFTELIWKTENQWAKQKNRTSMMQHLRDYSKDLPPRWKAALWTLEEDMKSGGNKDSLPWIDSRFFGGLNVEFRQDLIGTGLDVNGQRMDEYEMSGYKYQVDLGG